MNQKFIAGKSRLGINCEKTTFPSRNSPERSPPETPTFLLGNRNLTSSLFLLQNLSLFALIAIGFTTLTQAITD